MSEKPPIVPELASSPDWPGGFTLKMAGKLLYVGYLLGEYEPTVWVDATGALLTLEQWKTFGQIVLKIALDQKPTSDSMTPRPHFSVSKAWEDGIKLGAAHANDPTKLAFYMAQGPDILNRMARANDL